MFVRVRTLCALIWGAGLSLAPALAVDLARPSSLHLSADESSLLVTLADADRLVVVSAADGEVQASIPTAPGPSGAVFVPSRGEIWVVCRLSQELRRYAADTLQPLGAISIPRLCQRIALTPDSSRAYVTAAGQDALLAIDTIDLAIQAIPLPGRYPRDILIDPTGQRAYVAMFLSESVAVVDLAAGSVITVIPVGATPAAPTLTGDGIVVGHLGLDGSTADDAVTNKVSVIDEQTLSVAHEHLLPLATPCAAAPSAAGAVWVVCFGSDRLAEVDAATGGVLRTIAVGANPIAVERRSDGRLYVLNSLGDSISVVDDGGVSAAWPLNPSFTGLDTPARRGEHVFNTALGSRANTCNSCHPGGLHDGLSRLIAPPAYLDSLTINTPSLELLQWTPPYRRVGSVSSAALHVASIYEAVQGEPIESGELTDLVAYLRTLGPQPNPHARDLSELTPLQQQGRDLFVQMQCALCHSGPAWTDGRAHHVGTGGDADTPSLLSLWFSGPYLHDGRAATLADVFAPLPGRHSPAVADAGERDALAAYLITLPNPTIVWRAVPRVRADGTSLGEIAIQLFDAATGRPRAGVGVVIEEETGLAGLSVSAPPPTDQFGQTVATVSGITPGMARFRVRVDGALTSDSREVALYVPARSLANVAASAGLGQPMPANAYPRAAAVADYDRDGFQDLFLAVSGKNASGQHVGAASYLFRNRGDGTFEDVTAAAGLLRSMRSSAGAAFADFDNDGDPDLYVNNRGAPQTPATVHELFRNNGDGTFTDVAPAAGVENGGFGYSVLWLDYDRDGDLDVFVQNLVVGASFGNLTPDALYRNDADGTFTDVTGQADLEGWSVVGGDGGAVADYDDDGRQDLLKVAIDYPLERVFLLHNDGDGVFSDLTAPAGLDFPFYSSRGATFGDYDNDGDLDLFVVGVGLFRNNGDMPRTFTNVTGQIGFNFTSYTGRRFGHAFVDLNNDGWLDIVAENRTGPMAVLMNLQNGQFSPYTDVDYVIDTAPDPKVALAVLDIENDGDMDIFLGREGAAGGLPQALYENRFAGDNRFLRVELIGAAPFSARTPLGARVFVQTAETTQMHELWSGQGAAGGLDTLQHFGLGQADAAMVSVRWPDGHVDSLGEVAADTQILVTEGQPGYQTVRSWFRAQISASAVSGSAPLTVDFHGSVLNGQPPYLYVWDFGDGSTLGTGADVSHVFTGQPGARNAELMVRDAGGATTTATITITLNPFRSGDMNCDGVTNVLDINPFILALQDPFLYNSSYPECDITYADMNGDGDVNVLDINHFISAVEGG
ncbi:ASPIC and UnbV [Phycisphaerae bacterium RAS1]|nr:ASPIC and UnbV [Phycisphaerae bacterium RAS1]